MSHELLHNTHVVQAIAPGAGAAGTMTPVEVNATGYDRVLFVINVAAPGAGSTIAAKAQDSATSGGSLADTPNAALTTLTQAGGDGANVHFIDVTVNQARPFLKFSLVVTGASGWANGVDAILYRGSGTYPKAAAAGQQLVLA